MTSDAGIRAMVEASYVATVARLTGDEEFERLKRAALREAADTPDYWVGRNLLWLRIEAETPLR